MFDADSSTRNRRSERIHCSLPVKWMRHGIGVDIKALDMSCHGMFLSTGESVAPGSLMQLDVGLADGDAEPVRMFVTVRFVGETVSGRGLGVELFAMSRSDESRWLAHYRRTLRKTGYSGDARHVSPIRAVHP